MSSDPMIGQDEGTQRMVQEAKDNFPEKTLDEAVQQQANMGPGREAYAGEGSGVSGIVDMVNEAALSAVDKVKQTLPPTRDMKEPHC